VLFLGEQRGKPSKRGARSEPAGAGTAPRPGATCRLGGRAASRGCQRAAGARSAASRRLAPSFGHPLSRGMDGRKPFFVFNHLTCGTAGGLRHLYSRAVALTKKKNKQPYQQLPDQPAAIHLAGIRAHTFWPQRRTSTRTEALRDADASRLSPPPTRPASAEPSRDPTTHRLGRRRRRRAARASS